MFMLLVTNIFIRRMIARLYSDKQRIISLQWLNFSFATSLLSLSAIMCCIVIFAINVGIKGKR